MASGVKRTVTVQELVGVRVPVPQPSETIWKRVLLPPPMAGTALKTRSAEPVLVIVTGTAALGVLTCWLPKSTPAGFSDAAGAAAAVPVPVSPALIEVPPASVT